MSLKREDWMKILGGLALTATGAGLAGVGPLVGLFGGASGATGAGAATAGGFGSEMAAMLGAGEAAGMLTPVAASSAGASGFGNLVAPTLTTQGIGTTLSGARGSPTMEMKTPLGVPKMSGDTDPWQVLRMIQQMKQGGI